MNWLIQLLACALAASCFSVLLHQPRGTIPASTSIATAGYAVFLLLGKTTLAYFGATLIIGVCCEICARLMKRTATLFVTAAIIPLCPASACTIPCCTW